METSGFTPASSSPWPRARPDVGSTRPVRQRRIVDLPEPDWPSKASSSPSRTARSMFSSTFSSWPPAVLYDLVTAQSSATAGLARVSFTVVMVNPVGSGARQTHTAGAR